MRALTAVVALALAAPAARGDDGFEKHVRPVLVEHCYECHSARSNPIEGQLRLDSRSGWQVGGEHGPAIVPGDADKSLLVKALRYASYCADAARRFFASALSLAAASRSLTATSSA